MLQVKSSGTLELEYLSVSFVVFGSCSQIWVSFPIKGTFPPSMVKYLTSVMAQAGIETENKEVVCSMCWILDNNTSCMWQHDKLRKKLESGLEELICSFFVTSWTGVVKYHGRPSIRPKQVFVANHTSMINFIVLEQMTAFAVIMQKHPGWVGLLQSTILESLGRIWFNRSESKDCEIVARKLREHVNGAGNNPLLILPEGTCVNNHCTVMFKKQSLAESILRRLEE